MLNKKEIMYLSEHTEFWSKLTPDEQNDVLKNAFSVEYQKGKNIYSNGTECLGLVLIEKGQLRAYINSNEGRQITLYRLLPLDICIFSASCMIRNLNFDMSIEVEKDSKIYVIPTNCFNKINDSNSFVKSFIIELISARFSEVMWVFDQYVFGSAAKRLANFLIEQSNLEASDTLYITHEFIANDLGTAREVVTRLLQHFSKDGLVTLNRGSIRIEKMNEIKKLC